MIFEASVNNSGAANSAAAVSHVSEELWTKYGLFEGVLLDVTAAVQKNGGVVSD